MLSASSLDDEHAAAVISGCDDFLRKPFRDHEIVDLLTTHLGARGVYEEEPPVIAVPNMGVLSALFADVPSDLLERLHYAAMLNDFTLMNSIIAEIRPHQPDAAW